MKSTLNIIAVGAGGVASYLFPALSKTFNLSGYLIDGDKLEKHNLDRQMFNPQDVGKFKAESLIKHQKLTGIRPRCFYLDESSLYNSAQGLNKSETDIVICMVDNHPARRAAIKLAEHLDCSIVIVANEYATSQVQYWHPDLAMATYPFYRYPEILTSNEGSPINCTGEALESTPQLAIANQVSAALANFMIYLWHDVDHETINPGDHMPIEFQTTFGKIETVTLGDL